MATLMDADAEAVFNQLQVFVQGAAEGGEALRVRRAEVKLADGGEGGVQAGGGSGGGGCLGGSIAEVSVRRERGLWPQFADA